MPRSLALAVLPLALLAAALAGCTQPTRLPPPEPSAAGEPLFASDDEALEAATAAYEEYLAVVDRALSDPGQDVDLESVASGEALDALEQSREEFRNEGLRVTGSRSLGGSELQQWFGAGTETAVVAYFCEDVSGVTLLDESGDSLSSPDRPNYSVFEVAIEFESVSAKVASRAFWENVESC